MANKLAKGFLGTNNFDANSRLCIASAVAGYTTSLGSDGPPPAYADIELADCFFIIGRNTAECHPIVFRRLKRRKEQAPAAEGRGRAGEKTRRPAERVKALRPRNVR